MQETTAISQHYLQIARAITFIRENFRSQPSLDQVAAAVNMSVFHFQRLFSEWAGVSPKKFLQYLSLEHSKELLRQQHSIVSASEAAGLSGTSRLHDLFISIEAITPGEYKKGARGLQIRYSFHDTLFGPVIAASTDRGLCYLSFLVYEEDVVDICREDTKIKSKRDAVRGLMNSFPQAQCLEKVEPIHCQAVKIFHAEPHELPQIKLHLRATPFQLKVWQALLNIPEGSVATYSGIARQIEHPGAARAVGSAIGSNPVAFLIPCHRVIQSTGSTGGYMWGSTRKSTILAWEQCRADPENGTIK